jgi:hypothetical protein
MDTVDDDTLFGDLEAGDVAALWADMADDDVTPRITIDDDGSAVNMIRFGGERIA